MKIKLKEIPREGLHIGETVKAKDIDFVLDGLKVLSPLAIEGVVRKAKGAVSAEVTVAGEYEASCARCLEPVKFRREDDFDIVVDVDPTDDIVDLGEEIRQEMVINISTIALCKKDCKGLCPKCGANLNKEKCLCPK